MKSRIIFFIAVILSTYLLFQLLKDDSPVTYSWLTEQHISEAVKVLEPVLPKLEEYVMDGHKRLPRSLGEVGLGHMENIQGNRFVAGLAIRHFDLMVRLKDAETGKQKFFTMSPQPALNGVIWNCNMGDINPDFFANAFPDCQTASTTPYGRLMDMVGMQIQAEAEKAIAQGADVNQVVEGRYPLYLAIKKKSTRMVRFLISKGANVNLVNKDDYGKTPLMYAAEQNELEIIKILVESGADVNARDSDGESVLSYVDKKNYELVDYLVEKGATVKL